MDGNVREKVCIFSKRTKLRESSVNYICITVLESLLWLGSNLAPIRILDDEVNYHWMSTLLLVWLPPVPMLLST